MSAARIARLTTVWLWVALAASLLCWTLAGYSWPLCTIAVLVLLAPLRGLIRGARYTYAWATLFAIPYLIFVITEILANPAARWVGAVSLFLAFAWFCAMVSYLRVSRGLRG